jgi:hypothetical protein
MQKPPTRVVWVRGLNLTTYAGTARAKAEPSRNSLTP